MRRHPWILLGLALLAGLAVPLWHGGGAGLSLLGQVPWTLFVLGPLLAAIAWNFSALRLRLMARGHTRLGQREALATVMATECVVNATPMGLAGPVAYATLLGRHGLRSADGAAIYTMDQLVDLTFFILLIPVVVWWCPLWPPGLGAGATVTAGLLLILVLIAAAVLLRFRGILLWSNAVGGKAGITPRARRRIGRFALQFRRRIHEMLAIPAPRLLAIYGVCALQWITRYSVLYFILWGLNVPMAWATVFLVQIVALSAGQVGMTPGGAGVAELGSTALLAPYVAAPQLATAILLWRFATCYWHLLAGAPVLLVLLGRHGVQKLRRQVSEGS